MQAARTPTPPNHTHTQPRARCHSPPPDAKAELLRLNRALLVLFLELLSVLVEQPSAYAETLTRVIGALQNMQHLVNMTRIDQASRLPASLSRCRARASVTAQVHVRGHCRARRGVYTPAAPSAP
jgi:hypothetical protein